jgi:hypothetical protein
MAPTIRADQQICEAQLGPTPFLRYGGYGSVAFSAWRAWSKFTALNTLRSVDASGSRAGNFDSTDRMPRIAPIAKAAGITDDKIDRIAIGAEGRVEQAGRALICAADDLFENSVVSDETWKTLSERYNTE